jgi:hypothetical protein
LKGGGWRTARHSRNRRIFSCHKRALQAVKFAREKPSPRAAPSDLNPWNSNETSISDRYDLPRQPQNRGFANIARAQVQHDGGGWRCLVAQDRAGAASTRPKAGFGEGDPARSSSNTTGMVNATRHSADGQHPDRTERGIARGPASRRRRLSADTA